MNQGLVTIESATQFGAYVNGIYRTTVLPLLASTTRNNYEYVLNRHLLPMFSDTPLRDLKTLTLQRYFSSTKVSHASASKIRDVFASVLGSAVRFDLLVKNPLVGVQLAPSSTAKRTKPHLTPEQFDRLVSLMAEPYATMVYVCVMAGLRVSELMGLKWEDVHADSLTIDERYCRGDWGCPKTTASGATIGVDKQVIARIFRLKGLEVTINWGARGAKKTFKVARSDAPHDLVFQSLRTGAPMSDHNILTRHLKPAAVKLDIGWCNWQVLRRSYATWLVASGADPKAVQGQMRHSRIGTTMDTYAQFVPESQELERNGT
jgi:integrase